MHRLDYPTAHTVSHTIAEHFRHEVQAAGIKADIPDTATIERIINAVFWASLRREEGRAPTISVAYLPPAATALLVEHPLPLDPAPLTTRASRALRRCSPGCAGRGRAPRSAGPSGGRAPEPSAGRGGAGRARRGALEGAGGGGGRAGGGRGGGGGRG